MSEKSPRGMSCLKLLLGGAALGVLLLAGLAWGMRVSDSRPFCSRCDKIDMQTGKMPL